MANISKDCQIGKMRISTNCPKMAVAPMMDWYDFNYYCLLSIGYRTAEVRGSKKVAKLLKIAAALITIFILVAKSAATKMTKFDVTDLIEKACAKSGLDPYDDV